MADVSIVYADFPHEGLVVLRRAADGTLLDHDSAWVSDWEDALSIWRWTDPSERATVDEMGLPLPTTAEVPDEIFESLVRDVEVVPPGVEVGRGIQWRQLTWWDWILMARAQACAVEVVHDDATVDAATTRMFTRCSCYLPDRPDPITFTSHYSGFTTVDRSARIIRDDDRGWSLVVCPWSFEVEQDVWVDTWTCRLDDEQRLYDTFSSDAWDTNVIDSSVDELCSVLRDSGEPELISLAERIQTLQG